MGEATRVHEPYPGAARDGRPKRQRYRVRAADGQWYSNRRWRRLRAAILSQHPGCADPLGIHHRARHAFVAASEVHHLIPRRRAPELAYRRDNLQALCSSCHSRLTAIEQAELRREDGTG
jgi:5-methylcytosine-specific restriction protein A